MLAWLEDRKFEEYQPPKSFSVGAYELLRGQPEQVMKTGQVMHTDLITADPEMTVTEALKMMTSHLIHHLPILEEGCLVGLVSDRDLFDCEDHDETLVDDIMSERLLTASPESAVWTVAQIMLTHHINCVLIVDEERRLLGLLTSLDILACMTHQAPYEVWL